ncbi:DedA family protein [soil metagenome]
MQYFIDTLTGLPALYGYALLFFCVMLENAGIPLPGETTLVAAGYLASAVANYHLSLGLVIFAAFTGAVIGDNVGYWVGRTFAKRRLSEGRRFLFLTPERLKKTETYFEKYGVMTVFFGRFIALLRIAAGPAAGVAGMSWRRFFIANAAGAAVWAAIFGVLGYVVGPAWEEIHRWLGRGAWAIAGLAVLIIIAWHFLPYFRSRWSATVE